MIDVRYWWGMGSGRRRCRSRPRGPSVAHALRAAFVACTLALPTLQSLPAHGGETVYRVVGPDGQVSYTDTPPEQGKVEVVELKDANTQPSLEVSGPRKPTDGKANPYTRVEITSPENDATILPDQLNVVVQLEVEPSLQGGHRVQFFLDGEPQGVPAATTAIALGDLYRGTRTIQATIFDGEGAVIAQSNAVAIHVKRHSAKHPSGRPRPPKK